MRTRATDHHGDLPAGLCREAVRLVRSDGAQGFSLRRAARALGVDVAAVYRHHRDREALLRAVARVGFGQLADAMAQEGAGRRGAEDRLRAVGHA